MTTRTTAERGSVLNIALILGLLVMVAVGVVGILWATEKVELPALDRLLGRERKDEDVLPGRVPVPVSARYLTAYQKVTKDDLWDMKNGGIKFMYLDPTKLGGSVITNAADILNRVMARDKEPGYVFSKSDFLPEGTRPGMTAGIPPGKVSRRISADKVTGLHGLNRADRFYMMATFPVETQDSRDLDDLNLLGAAGRQLVMDTQERAKQAKDARVEIIVEDGYVVEGVQARMTTKTVQTLTQGKLTRSTPVQEMVIAITMEEAWKLERALALGAEVTCLARSSNPEDPADLQLPDFEAESERDSDSIFSAILGPSGSEEEENGAPFGLQETIRGSERDVVFVPKKKKSSADKVRREIDPSRPK